MLTIIDNARRCSLRTPDEQIYPYMDIHIKKSEKTHKTELTKCYFYVNQLKRQVQYSISSSWIFLLLPEFRNKIKSRFWLFAFIVCTWQNVVRKHLAFLLWFFTTVLFQYFEGNLKFHCPPFVILFKACQIFMLKLLSWQLKTV
jgi:hypothetical protein